jgi:hypothetical protein
MLYCTLDLAQDLSHLLVASLAFKVNLENDCGDLRDGISGLNGCKHSTI